MGVTNHFIDVDKLKETIERVDDICQNNKQYENQMMEELTTLEKTIKINLKSQDNKKGEVEKNIITFQKNCEGTKQSYLAVINRYQVSVVNAKNFIETKKSNLRRIDI